MLSIIQDHAGHIHGVDSNLMIEKLEQYNGILEVGLNFILNCSWRHLNLNKY